MLQQQSQRRLFCVRLLTLISGASFVDCASAQYSDRYPAETNQARPTVAASDIRGSGANGVSSYSPTPQTAPVADFPNQQMQFARQVNTTLPAGHPSGYIERSSLEMIAPQAQAHINYALNLAERGAVQSAQAEFVVALDLIADALDADTRNETRAHARAIQAGLTAIEETKDFVPADTPHNVVLNVAQIAATHHTPVLKNVDVSRITRAEALQHYHAFATQQLAFAGGQSAIASSALYGLGRAECVTTAGASTRNPLGAPNAMALYQAALLVEPQNFMASNELGVLMARYGDLQSAASQLEHSLSIKPQVETWHNLATVYRRMGQTERAEQADREREKLLATPIKSSDTAKNATDLGSRTNIQWVDVDTFAATATPYGLDGPPADGKKSAAITQRDSLGKRVIAKLNPWSKTDKPQKNTDATQSSSRSDSPPNGNADSRSLFR